MFPRLFALVVSFSGVAAKEFFTTTWCEAYGYDNSIFEPAQRAYEDCSPPCTPDPPLGGHAEGTCGYVAAEDDSQWVRCCCLNTMYCHGVGGGLCGERDCESGSGACDEDIASSGAPQRAHQLSHRSDESTAPPPSNTQPAGHFRPSCPPTV